MRQRPSSTSQQPHRSIIDRQKMFGLILTLLFIDISSSSSMGSKADLESAARKAHTEIPFLRRREQERWSMVGERLMEFAQPYQRKLATGYYKDDNYEYMANQYNANQQNEPVWNPFMSEEQFGFDITKYSFKYTGCHEIGYTLQVNHKPSRYTTFRLCPTGSCSGQSTWGCQSDYGEYIVPADLLLTSLVEHNQARVTGYCEYCHKCAALESYKQFFGELSMHKEYVVTYAKQKFQTWCAQNGYCSSYTNSEAVTDDYIYQNAAQALWKEMRKGNYASNYVSQSHSQQGYSQSYGYADSRQSWRFQGDNSISSQYADEQRAWQTMGSTFGTWYDRTIYPGYYDSYDQFHACWGYNSEAAGRFICLDKSEKIYWDSDIYGTVPSTWTEFMENGYLVDEEESCDSRYSSSCYNQYDACMEVFSQQQQYDDGSRSLTLKEVLQCIEISEEQIQYSALAFYEEYIVSQDRFRQYNKQNPNYDKYNYNSQSDQGYGQARLFVGPACGGDNRSIQLAVYGDASCTKKVKGITVRELLGYSPLDDSMDIFPPECISCHPPEEFAWYEAEVQEEQEILDPVLPFCSMLYQLSGKCNTKLKPIGMYDANTLYEYQQNDNFLVDICSTVESLNKDIYRKESAFKKMRDNVRMSMKAMSPAARSAIVIVVFLLAGAVVMGTLSWYMQSVLSDEKTVIGDDDLAEIPAFKYQNAELKQTDSGVGRARGDKVSRSRTAPAQGVKY